MSCASRRIRSGRNDAGRRDREDRSAIAPGFLPDGVALRPSGDSEFFGQMVQSMTIAIVTSAMLVYFLMVMLYGSFLTPFVVMFSIPVAIVGALFALAISHQTLNLFRCSAMIMLFGLVAKNGILLVDYANTMRSRGMRVADAMQAAAEPACARS